MITVLPHSTFTTKRFGAATTSATGTTHGAETAGTTTGTISAASPQDIARLEEGKRTRQAFKYITADTLQTAQKTGLLPDWIQVGSDWYEVSALAYWANSVIPHNEYIVVKIENPADAS